MTPDVNCDSTFPELTPSVQFTNNEVQISIRKAKLAPDQFIRNIESHDYWRYSKMMEVSFRFVHEGENYIFSVSRTSKMGQQILTPILLKAEFDTDSKDEVIGYKWESVETSLAQNILDTPSFQNEIAHSLDQANINTSANDYLEEVKPQVNNSFVSGSMYYNMNSKCLFYRQKVTSSNPFFNNLLKLFGERDIIKLALKVCFISLSEFILAGNESLPGTPVKSIEGDTFSADN